MSSPIHPAAGGGKATTPHRTDRAAHAHNSIRTRNVRNTVPPTRRRPSPIHPSNTTPSNTQHCVMPERHRMPTVQGGRVGHSQACGAAEAARRRSDAAMGSRGVRRATRHVHAPPPAALTVHPQTSTERPKPNCGRNAGSRHHITLTLTLSGHQVAPPASGGCPPPSIRRRAAAKPPPPMHPAACVAASPSPLQPSVVGHPNSNRQRRPSLGPSAGHSARLGLSPVTAPRRASCRTAPRR